MKYNCKKNNCPNPSNCKFFDKYNCMLNKSVYYKMYYDQYFLGKENAELLDKEILPNDIFSLISSKKGVFRDRVMNYFVGNGNFDENKQRLVINIITFYKNLQLKYNNLNLGKCCSQLKVPKWNSNMTKSQINCCEAHDLYVYLFYRKNGKFSYFYNLFLVATKIQKFLYSNFRKYNQDSHFKTYECDDNCKTSINCKKLI